MVIEGFDFRFRKCSHMVQPKISFAPIPLALLGVVLMVGCGGGSSGALSFSIARVPGLEDYDTAPVALNERGVVLATGTGGGIPEVYIGRAFIWDGAHVREVGTLGAGWSFAEDINVGGEVVGTSSAAGNWMGDPTSAFRWKDGRIAALPSPYDSGAEGMNDYGDIVGWTVQVPGQLGRAVRWDGDSMSELGTLPGFQLSYALDINNAGHVVCNAREHSYWTERAYVWKSGEIIELGTFGGRSSTAHAINERGQIVGTADTGMVREAPYQNVAISHAFMWENGRLADIGTLGGKDSVAHAINDHGWIVGISEIDMTSIIGGEQSQFLYMNGEMLDLNRLIPRDSGWQLFNAVAINNRGQILATGNLGVCLLTPR